MDFDIRPTLSRLRLPVLLIFGESDRWVPIDASLDRWRTALGPDADLTVARIAGTGHHLTLPVDPRDLSEAGPIAPQYERTLVSWLRERFGPAHPATETGARLK